MIDLLLQTAIEMNNVDWVEALLDEKPQRLQQRDEYGQPLLIVAVLARNRSLDCIEALLNAGADVNSRNAAGFTALHVVIWDEYFPAESASSEEIINLLLDAGAELEDELNVDAQTPLMHAVLEACCSDARLLLARGANPHKLFSNQSSQITLAGLSLLSVSWREPEMMQILLEGGADVNLRDGFGQTALEHIQGQDAKGFEAEQQHCLDLLRRANSPR